jgi:hypothetical protein
VEGNPAQGKENVRGPERQARSKKGRSAAIDRFQKIKIIETSSAFAVSISLEIRSLRNAERARMLY